MIVIIRKVAYLECDVDCFKELCSNVVLFDGSIMFLGIDKRIQKEFKL